MTIRNIKQFRKLAARASGFKKFMNFFYLFMTKLRHSMSAFSDHINSIIFFGSNEKMAWVHARWNIASMADKTAYRYLANEKPVTHSMREIKLSANSKAAISISYLSAGPKPTFISFINVAHESIYRHVSFLTESVA